MVENDLQERLFRFAVDVLKLMRSFKEGTDLNIISYQLGKSSTSSGANYEESRAAVILQNDFSNIESQIKNPKLLKSLKYYKVKY